MASLQASAVTWLVEACEQGRAEALANRLVQGLAKGFEGKDSGSRVYAFLQVECVLLPGSPPTHFRPSTPMPPNP